jgi:hypothetical protein
MIGKAVSTDRVSIWKNDLRNDRLHCFQIQEWTYGDLKINQSLKLGISYDLIPGWEKILSRGDCINSLVKDMSPPEQAQLSPDGVLSIFVVPVFINEDKFWGFVCFEICHEEKIYNETEQSILRSGGLLIANAFVRHEMTQNIHETAALLQNVVANHPGIIWRVNKDGMLTLFDGMLVKKLGVESDIGPGIATLDNVPQNLITPEIIGYIRKTLTQGTQE